MTEIAVSTETDETGEYALALRSIGATPRLLRFDVATLDQQLEGVGGVMLSGGGDVDPQRYGLITNLATEVNVERDEFEIALVRRARERGMPTLCICRGLQLANVAFGGTLVPDLGSLHGLSAAALHRVNVDGISVRVLIAGHDVDIAPDSRLARIVGRTSIATGSRHHQSVAAIAPDLRIVATTRDGIVEAAEARFPSPFWLGVQWHPESTMAVDGGTSQAIFTTFVEAAGAFAIGRDAA